jgi:molybdopterin molybdotransferase
LDTIALDKALEKALQNVEKRKGHECVGVDRALGRVLAEDLSIRRDLPPFDNSAMDGFAIRHTESGRTLRIAATLYAGDRPEAILGEGECYRIMTGAPVPSDADAVVPFEKCTVRSDGRVEIPPGVRREANLRRRGEELSAGGLLFRAGTRLDASHLALLAAQGITAVSVNRVPRIVVLATGNELKEPWEFQNQ